MPNLGLRQGSPEMPISPPTTSWRTCGAMDAETEGEVFYERLRPRKS
jgi:ribulose bisphosphate carboxylase small subunit